jgi:hypothetical protein
VYTSWAFILAVPGQQKPDLKLCGLGLTRPDCRAAFFSLAHWAKKSLGCRGVEPGLQSNIDFSSQGPAHPCCQAKISSLGPARQHVLDQRAGPFSGQANLAGLAMLRFNSVVVSHDEIDALVVVFGQFPVNEHS